MSNEYMSLLEPARDDYEQFRVSIVSPSKTEAILMFQDDDLVLQALNEELLYKISYYDITKWMSSNDGTWVFEYKDSLGTHRIGVSGVDPRVLSRAIGDAIKEIMNLTEDLQPSAG